MSMFSSTFSFLHLDGLCDCLTYSFLIHGKMKLILAGCSSLSLLMNSESLSHECYNAFSEGHSVPFSAYIAMITSF